MWCWQWGQLALPSGLPARHRRSEEAKDLLASHPMYTPAREAQVKTNMGAPTLRLLPVVLLYMLPDSGLLALQCHSSIH
jgi:hypothetical protein